MAIDAQYLNSGESAHVQAILERQADLPRRITLLDRVALYSLCIGTVLVVLLDWLGTFEYISLGASKYARAFLLAVFALYIVRTGISLSAYGFRFGRVLTYFMALCVVHSLLSDDVVENLYYSTRALFWVLGAVVAYRLFISRLLTEKIFSRMIVATCIIGAVFTVILMRSLRDDQYENASAYLLLFCVPLLFLTKKSWSVIICFAAAVVAILITVKRGAIIGLLLSITIYGLFYLKMHMNMRTFIKILGVLLFLGAIGAYGLSSRWDLIEKRFEDSSGSGRDYLYPMLINHYVQADLTHHIFGFGINSVQRYTGQLYRRGEQGIYAHSDVIQFMYDFGIFGILFLVWLHLQFLVLIFKYYTNNHPHAPPLIMGYVILLLVNIYSGQLMNPNTVYLALLWAVSPLENFNARK